MIQINFKENYILFSFPNGKYYGYKTGTIRHEIEGSAISFFLLDNEVGEQPVLNFNYLNCMVEGVQATEDNINDLLSVIYNGITTDVKVISFTLDSEKDELKIEQNDDTYYTVSLSKYNFTGDISNLLSLINTETERAKAAEKANADAIAAVDTAYKAADAILQGNINTEVERATNAESALDTKIETLVAAEMERAISEETRIETKVEDLVNTETERAKAAEKANSDAIAAEVERAKAAEKDLSDRIDANGGELAAETERAQAAEAELNSKIEAEITRATEAETVLNAKIDTEVKAEADRAKAEEARIETKAEELISAETERATAAEQANTDAISALDAAYKAADTTLSTKIDTLVNAEVERAKAAEKVNADAIIAEKERAVAAENIIRNSLNDEIGRAQEAEAELNTAITTEVTRAKSEETRIETKFDEVVSTLDSKITTNKTAIEAEVERATTAETLIDKKIDDEVTRAKDAEKINSDSIENEVVRAKAAEKAIADDLNAEIIRAKAAEKANNDTINAEAERAKAAEVSLDGKIDIEIARATKAEEDFAVLLAGTSGNTSYSNIKVELDKLGDGYNSIRSIAVTLKNFLNSGGVSDAIDSFKELQDFLEGITDSQTLASLLLELKNEILGGAGDNINTLKKVYDALSGNTGGDVDLSNYYTKSEVDAKDSTKVDKVNGKGLSTEDYTTAEKSKLASLSNYDDSEIRSLIENTYTKSEVDAKIDEAVAGGEVDLTNYYTKSETDSKISGKVDKVEGKQLSTEDYTTEEKTKLAGLDNYDDTTVKGDIAANTEAIEAEVTRAKAAESTLNNKIPTAQTSYIGYNKNFVYSEGKTGSTKNVVSNISISSYEWGVYIIPRKWGDESSLKSVEIPCATEEKAGVMANYDRINMNYLLGYEEITPDESGKLQLLDNRITQHTVITGDTRISLPVNLYNDIKELHLIFEGVTGSTITFPYGAVWKEAPTEIVEGATYEFIFTWIKSQNKWYAGYIKYE